MGRAVFPPCCLTWGQTMVGVMIMGTSFKRSHAHNAALSAPDHAAGHHWSKPLPETPEYSRASLDVLWGHCSFLLGPGAYKVLFVPSKSLFPQYFVSSGSSIVGLMATSSKRAYAIPRSAAPRAPAPVGRPLLPHETLKHSKAGLAQSLWHLLVRRTFSLSSPSISGRYGVWF